MVKLMGLLGVTSAIAIAAGLVLWRKQRRSRSWSSKAADKITGAVADGSKKASSVAGGVANAVRA